MDVSAPASPISYIALLPSLNSETATMASAAIAFLSAIFVYWLAERAKIRQAKADLNFRLHVEFQGYLPQRIAVWNAYFESAVKDDLNAPHYLDFWNIVAFYQRLGVLLEDRQLNVGSAAKLHGSQAYSWYKHFFDHPRVSHLAEQDEIALARTAWPLLKRGATKDQLELWMGLSEAYDNHSDRDYRPDSTAPGPISG